MREANGSHGVNDTCPGCGSIPLKTHDPRHSGQHHQCQACGGQWVPSADERFMSDARHALVEHLLRERLSLRGICRAVGVSLTWLLHVMVERCAACPEH